MKSAPTKAKKPLVLKTISMPEDLYQKIEEKISRDPELDFSKYIRLLVRRDIFPTQKAA